MVLEIPEATESYFLENDGGHQGNQAIPVEFMASGINSSRSKRETTSRVNNV